MSIVDVLLMGDSFEQDCSTPFKSTWPEAAQLPSHSSAPVTSSFSHSQRSATLGWAQQTGFEESQGQHERMAPVSSIAPDATYGASDAHTFAGPGRRLGEGITDFSWDMALLEELEKGSLGTTVTSALKMPDPIISFKTEPPLLITPSLPPVMAADDQERAKACWDVFRSISEPPNGLLPVQQEDQRGSPMATGSGGPSRSGGTSDTSSKRARKATSTRKRASPHSQPTPETRPQRDEAARARNARNQQLHRQRQRDKLEASERRRDELEERVKHLTMVNAGLHAHNQVLEASELEHLCTDSQQGGEGDALWGSTLGVYSASATAAHQKLAAVFTCIALGMGRGPVSADEVALMSPEDVFLFRQQYSAYLGRLFSRGAQTEGCAAHAELIQIVTLWADCEAHLWQHCPQTVHCFEAFAQQRDAEQGVMPNLLKWQSILAQLGLTAAQKGALKQAHRRLFDQLLNVTAERFHVSAMLKANCPDPAAGNTWQGSRTFLRVREAHKRLSASIRSEHILMRDAHLTFRQVATPVQQATCEMLAYPGAFDIIALLNLLQSGH